MCVSIATINLSMFLFTKFLITILNNIYVPTLHNFTPYKWNGCKHCPDIANFVTQQLAKSSSAFTQQATMSILHSASKVNPPLSFFSYSFHSIRSFLIFFFFFLFGSQQMVKITSNKTTTPRRHTTNAKFAAHVMIHQKTC